jgi:hypothetical protein
MSWAKILDRPVHFSIKAALILEPYTRPER